MIARIKELLEFFSKNGMYLPMAYDASANKPSLTLLIFYVAMCLTTGSIIAFHFAPDKLLQPVLATLTFLGLAFVFYRLRGLDKVKFDIEHKSVELEDLPDAPTTEKKDGNQ